MQLYVSLKPLKAAGKLNSSCLFIVLFIRTYVPILKQSGKL